jgi:hypothetical protein
MKITDSPFEGTWQSRDVSPSGMFAREDMLVFSDNNSPYAKARDCVFSQSF